MLREDPGDVIELEFCVDAEDARPNLLSTSDLKRRWQAAAELRKILDRFSKELQ